MSAKIASRKYYRIIALICTLLVFFAATKVRAAELSRPDEELRVCKCDTDAIAVVGHLFVLHNYVTTLYLSPPAREVDKQLSPAFSLTYRGPPSLF